MRVPRAARALALVLVASGALVAGTIILHEVAHCAFMWARGASIPCEITLQRPGTAIVCPTQEVCVTASYRPWYHATAHELTVASARVGDIPAWEHPVIYAATLAGCVLYARWAWRLLRRARVLPL